MLSSSSSPEMEKRPANPEEGDAGSSNGVKTGETEQGTVVLTIPDVALVGSQVNSERIVPGNVTIVDRGYAKYMLWRRSDRDSPEPGGGLAPTSATGPAVGFHRGGFSAEGDSVSVSTAPAAEPCDKFRPLPLEVDLAEVRSLRVTERGTRCVIVQQDGSTSGALRFPARAALDSFLDTVHSVTPIERSCRDSQLYLAERRPQQSATAAHPLHEMALFSERSIGTVWKFMRDFQQDPKTATLSGFGRLTELMLNTRTPDQRPDEEIAEILKEQSFEFEPTRLQSTTQEGFEVVTEIRLGERRPLQRERPVSLEEWQRHQDAEGRLTDETLIRQRIFHGGLEPAARPAGWRFLLGCRPAHLTDTEAEQRRQRDAESYFRMKLQWSSMSEEQLERFTAMRDRRALVEKDVTRTDRAEPFFSGAENVRLLHDILVTYCMYNFDLGYVQGMSDLLSPILFVVRDEAEAFWCFVGFMNQVSSNFEMSQKGMEQQFADLHSLLQVHDPNFCAYLDRNDSSRMSFTFRWLLVWFKRELCWRDVQRLWEVLWTRLPCPGFVLLLAVAVLDQQRSTIVESSLGFSAIVKHINDLALHIDLEASLTLAEAIYDQFQRGERLPADVQRILGMAATSPSSGHTSTSDDERGYEMALASNFQ